MNKTNKEYKKLICRICDIWWRTWITYWRHWSRYPVGRCSGRLDLSSL